MAENLPANPGDIRHGFELWVKKILWRREWLPTPVFLPRKFHGQRSLVGYSPWGHEELNMTEKTHTHYHIYASSSKLSYKFHTPAYFVELHKLILKLMAVKGPRIAQNSIFKGWTQGLRDP